MATRQPERQYPRFDSSAKVSFKVSYQFRTEVNFKIADPKPKDPNSSFIGFSQNISVNGLCFESPKELTPGDKLWIELHLPKQTHMICMEGDVRWCRLAAVTANAPKQFLSGVLITKVNGKPVQDTIYQDEQYHVAWSQLLNDVLGEFARICRQKNLLSDHPPSE